jgi:hypothetical protein
MFNEIIEIDNIMPVDYQDRLEKHLTHPSFPWALTLDSVFGDADAVHRAGAVGFYHNIVFNNEQKSPDLPYIEPIILAFEDAMGGKIKIDTIQRIRIGLFTTHPSDEPHGPHVDAYFPHWTAVYYVTDCDGDIFIYNETYPKLLPKQAEALPQSLSIKKRCSPAKGKIVAFPGEHYHSSSSPTKTPLRIAITFNFTVKE